MSCRSSCSSGPCGRCSSAPRQGRVISVASGGMYTVPLDVDALDPDSRRLRRGEGLRALQARAGRARRGMDETPARHRGHGQHDAPRLGRHARPAHGASRVQPPARAAAAHPRARAPTRSSGWRPPPRPPSASGQFFLDRRPRAKHRLRRTRRPDEIHEASRLWRLCSERTAAFAALALGSTPPTRRSRAGARAPLPHRRRRRGRARHTSLSKSTAPLSSITSSRRRPAAGRRRRGRRRSRRRRRCRARRRRVTDGPAAGCRRG